MPILAASPPVSYAEVLAELGGRFDALLAEALRKPLNARVTAVTADTATLEWDPIPGATVYISGRTGTDNRGNGVTAIVEAPAATSRVFVWLKPATTYAVFVLAVPSGDGAAITFTTAPNAT